MISVDEAQQIINGNIRKVSSTECSLAEVYGCVLQEDILADRDLPPYDRVSMDGIAINLSSWKKNRLNNFPIEGIEQAGQEPLRLKKKTSCIEVMTGSVLPQGCDCVVPVEEISVRDNQASVNQRLQLRVMQNVHVQGADYHKKDVLIQKGCVIKSPEMAVLASVGKTSVRVSQQPKIAVFTTGDELVDINESPQPHQIRRSNSYAVRSALISRGFKDIDIFHLQDKHEEIKDKLQIVLNEYDVLILSGGVSVGRYDLLPQVLTELGIKPLFHKVKMKPGKPFWFGITKDGCPVFALPGNPVSTIMCCYRFVLPYLERSLGMCDKKQEHAVLSDNFQSKTTFTYFLPVKVENQENGSRLARAMQPNGSGDFASLAGTDGFVELKSETNNFSAGLSVPYYSW